MQTNVLNHLFEKPSPATISEPGTHNAGQHPPVLYVKGNFNIIIPSGPKSVK